MRERVKKAIGRIESSPSATAIRSGLVLLIPVLLIGAAMLILKSLPLSAYQRFLSGPVGVFLVRVFNYIYNATFGMLSVFVTITVSYSYSKERSENTAYSFGAVLSALISFFVLVGVLGGDAGWGALGVKGMFTAIISATLIPFFYFKLAGSLRLKIRPYSDGADVQFMRALGIFSPMLIIAAIIAVINAVLSAVTGAHSLHELFIIGINALFEPLGRSMLAGILIVLMSSVLWFFGIHGSDVMEAVMEKVFTPATEINSALVAAGKAPTEILTKEFFDVFVLIGGCGTAISLLIAILLFSKRANNRRLSKTAALPMLFNINEVMIFGFPVIYNPMLLIPFILTPLVSFLISYGAMAAGIVPLITSSVEWTTPVLLGGYRATGSIMGSLLQLVCVFAGVLIYRPFVRAYDRQQERRAKRHLEELVDITHESEATLADVTLTELASAQGETARALSADLEYAIEHNELVMYYQPQFDNRGRPVGAEALLRWFHPLYGAIYPPLIIELARESGNLAALELRILERAVADARAVWAATGVRSEISINITADNLCGREYLEYLEKLAQDRETAERICLEITEQTALNSGSETAEYFDRVRKLGFRFAIDDFSMGHTSLTYLQEHRFDLVKLDGSLVRGMRDNPRSRDIVASIINLSKTLGFEVLAEYVETEQMRASLEEIGCNLYQGYLFSPAIPRDKLIAVFGEKRDPVKSAP